MGDFLARRCHWPDHQTVHRNALRAAQRAANKGALGYAHRALGVADAWFLDGFAPSLNPDIWRDEVIELVAERSAP